jgi:GNAT superfamily N-acetyltransferase
MPPVSDIAIREGTERDAGRIVELIRELAVFEKLDHLFVNSETELCRWLFSGSPVAGCYVAEQDSEIVGYAIFFRTFSTFLGKPGLWLEDLYVTPAMRGKGVGKRLLRTLACATVDGGHGRLEWAVLDWNQSAIDFYQSLGAEIMPDWRMCRLTGETLERFAGAGGL